MTAETAPQQAPVKKEWWRHLVTATRRALAGIALASVAIVVVLSYLVIDGAICREAAGADTGVVRLCGPVGPDDLPALAVLVLVAVLLLLPDMSEISVPGLLTLKRAVAEQETKTEALADQVAQLSIRMQQVNTVTTYIYPPAPDQAAQDAERRDVEFRERHPAKAASGEGLAQTREQVSRAVDAPPLELPAQDRALAESEITRLWEGINELDPVENRRGMYRTAEQFVDPLFNERMATRAEWFEYFRQDLDAFRAVRNTVVHEPRNLTDEQVRAGVQLGRRLFNSLRDWISRGP